jgi:isocitrate/isopropylmalate dehydrogenase
MKIVVLPGDGIGPEIVAASMSVLKAADSRFGLGLAFDYEDVGFESLKKHGTTLRQEVLDQAKTYDGIILGTQSHADYPVPEKGGRNVSAGFRIGLDLYANVRPARTRPFLQSNMREDKSMDLVIMREATEGFYPDRNMSRGWGEVMPSPDMALSTRKITRHCSERIARRAFELAMTRRKKVTAIHKANSFHMTDGLFLEAAMWQKIFRKSSLTICWWTRPPHIWCVALNPLTFWLPRTSTVTFFPTWPVSCPVVWVLLAPSWLAIPCAAHKPSMARRPLSLARTSPTLPP